MITQISKFTPNPLPDLPRLTKTYHKTVYPYVSPSRPELNVSEKTLFITGAAGGIGSAICQAFAQADIAHLVMIGRTQSTLDDAKADLLSKYPELKVTTHAASVTDTAMMTRIIRGTGKIDVLICAHAICHEVTRTSTIDPTELLKILETNTVGNFNIMSSVIHEHVLQGWNHEVKVINMSSALSYIHICHLSGYAASKAAMNLLVSHLSMQWSAHGISIFSVCPTLSYTGLTGKVYPPESPIWEDANLSAGFCLWLCQPEAKFLTGKLLWAQWNVPELLEKKEWIEKQAWHLEMGLNLPSLERPSEGTVVVDKLGKSHIKGEA
ncbi:NAD(P)-binding protein [Lentithecium fluviatile CBS 122367]|uniref:NAD(P)-binding protein n=1 Tax=Lentithecium fluviatile CBS 122367 TaxID=1168545 RepID=A0A6G1JCS0_9PLEO|nr:NAD(P)-binding protein [Lentithecium fluviatile CBS 122367]